VISIYQSVSIGSAKTNNQRGNAINGFYHAMRKGYHQLVIKKQKKDAHDRKSVIRKTEGNNRKNF